MATFNHLRERTIGFYEVVTVSGGKAQRGEPMGWDSVLAGLSRVPVASRMYEGDSRMVGTIVTHHMQDHLLLHRVKDGGEWLSVMNFDTGSLRELEQSAHEGYLDTSVICFLPFGNVVGIMQGAVSAPSHKGLQNWLNALQVFPGRNLQVRPVVAYAETERLKAASGASRVPLCQPWVRRPASVG